MHMSSSSKKPTATKNISEADLQAHSENQNTDQKVAAGSDKGPHRTSASEPAAINQQKGFPKADATEQVLPSRAP